VGAITHEDYIKNIERLRLFLEGKKKSVIKSLEKDMNIAAKKQDLKRRKSFAQMFALAAYPGYGTDLRHRDAYRGPTHSKQGYRIEGYDISNISGTSAVGSRWCSRMASRIK